LRRGTPRLNLRKVRKENLDNLDNLMKIVVQTNQSSDKLWRFPLSIPL